MSDYTPYQKKLIDRYYKNFDAIKHQQLSEAATELYLAEGKKRSRLWKKVEEILRKLNGSRLASISNDNAAQSQGASGPASQAIGVLQEQPGDAGAYGAASDQRDIEWFTHASTGSITSRSSRSRSLP